MSSREWQDLSAFSMPPGFRGRSVLIVQLWWFVQATFFRWSPQAFYGWRRLLLRLFSAKIGRGVVIRPTAIITYPWKLSIDDYSWIGDDVVLYSLSNIRIGKHSVISQRSYLCGGGHDYTKVTFDMLAEDIVIGDEVWIATDVFVAPGVTIEDGCVVGARSSVFHDLPKAMICLGSPAKPIRAR